MRLTTLMVVAITVAIVATLWGPAVPGTAQAAPSAAPEGDAAAVRRMTVAELQEGMTQGTAVPVDVRSERSFRADHITGAIWLPYRDAERHLDRLPRDRTLVLYCT